ncbi:hypothetical protein [Streptomyces sp. WAC06614]|uniref:hypothetical protein n=1 Tax=Streptomyces sp. WAC06614 TaxID=2487416 RepID=UPI000F7BB033|nr:hypothetical protein [Streptomyces sp. WAC06614]RSS81418.1 hypothetical protein EF918_10445 [Streptomyces sp. WAC06614]
MLWPMLAIALGFVGVAVLGVLAVRVGLEARRLGREVARASHRIAVASGELEQATVDLAAQAGVPRGIAGR